MNRKLLWGAIAAGVLAVAVIRPVWLLFPFMAAQIVLLPSTISWDGHAAAARCRGAIGNLWLWPAQPAAACRAMWLCANEAVLSPWQQKALMDAIHRTPGCPEP